MVEPNVVESELRNVSSRELLGMYAAILDELVRRGVVRSRNAPLGDIAERLARIAYDGELAPTSEKSWDVRTEDERRLQVKARLVADSGRRARPQLSPFRSWDFDALVVVLFSDRDYSVVRAVELPVALVQERAREVKWVSGHRVGTSESLLGHELAVSVTAKFVDALERLDDEAEKK